MKQIYKDNQRKPITLVQLCDKLSLLLAKPILKVTLPAAGILHFKIGHKRVEEVSLGGRLVESETAEFTLVLWGDWEYLYNNQVCETSLRVETELACYNERMKKFIASFELHPFKSIYLAKNLTELHIEFGHQKILKVYANDYSFFNLHIFGEEFICAKNVIENCYSEPISLK